MKDQQAERISANETSIQLINQKLDFISEQIRDIKHLLTEGYVTKVEYESFCREAGGRLSKMEKTFNKIMWLVLAPIIGGAVIAAALIISQGL